MFVFVLTSKYSYPQIPLSPFSVTSKVFNSVKVEKVNFLFVLTSKYAYHQIPLSPFSVTSKVFNSVKVSDKMLIRTSSICNSETYLISTLLKSMTPFTVL